MDKNLCNVSCKISEFVLTVLHPSEHQSHVGLLDSLSRKNNKRIEREKTKRIEAETFSLSLGERNRMIQGMREIA